MKLAILGSVAALSLIAAPSIAATKKAAPKHVKHAKAAKTKTTTTTTTAPSATK